MIIELIKQESELMARIKGIVIPAAWDQNGKIITLAIATDDEKEYLIDSRRVVSKLIHLLRQEVVVTGTINQTRKNRYIQVKSYCRRYRDSEKCGLLKNKLNVARSGEANI